MIHGETTMSFSFWPNLTAKSCDHWSEPIRRLHSLKSPSSRQNLWDFVRFHPKFHSHLKSKAVRTALVKTWAFSMPSCSDWAFSKVNIIWRNLARQFHFMIYNLILMQDPPFPDVWMLSFHATMVLIRKRFTSHFKELYRQDLRWLHIQGLIKTLPEYSVKLGSFSSLFLSAMIGKHWKKRTPDRRCCKPLDDLASNSSSSEEDSSDDDFVYDGSYSISWLQFLYPHI